MQLLPCSQCENGEQRLVRYENGLGVWACRRCGYETPLLDCHTCERRLIRRLGRNRAGTEVWSCYLCQAPKLACPSCHAGWIVAGEQGSADCTRCKHHWDKASVLGDLSLPRSGH